MKLTPRQELFCREYIVDFNGAGAARRAGYASERAAQAASENLCRPNVTVFIAELMSGQHKRIAMTAEEVLDGISRIARSDRRNLVDENGRIKNLNDLDEETASAIDGYEVGRMGVKFKMSPRMGALTKLAERFNLLAEHEKNKKPVINITISQADSEL